MTTRFPQTHNKSLTIPENKIELFMINNFKDNEAQKIFSFEFSRKLPPDIQQKALMKLKSIDYAAELRDLAIVFQINNFIIF